MSIDIGYRLSVIGDFTQNVLSISIIADSVMNILVTMITYIKLSNRKWCQLIFKLCNGVMAPDHYHYWTLRVH